MTYNPWADAANRYPGVHIEWHPILPVHAAWAPGEDVILVDESISKVERRCALAHELAHMDTGDRPTASCFFSRKQETSADRLAAHRLIAIREMSAALRWCEDPRELAEALDVTLNVLILRAAMLHPAERGAINLAMSRRESVA